MIRSNMPSSHCFFWKKLDVLHFCTFECFFFKRLVLKSKMAAIFNNDTTYPLIGDLSTGSSSSKTKTPPWVFPMWGGDMFIRPSIFLLMKTQLDFH